jgi:hypothetical protein
MSSNSISKRAYWQIQALKKHGLGQFIANCYCQKILINQTFNHNCSAVCMEVDKGAEINRPKDASEGCNTFYRSKVVFIRYVKLCRLNF